MDPGNKSVKKRGPYKRYLEPGSNVPVPESTLRSREKRAKLVDQAEGGNTDDLEGSNDTLEQQDVDGVQECRTENVENISNPDDIDEPRTNDEDATDEDQVVEQDQVTDQLDNPTRNKKVDYVKKYNLNFSLHQATVLTRLDVLLMILHMAVRHCHTQKFVEDQISFVNTIFGENVLDISYHIFKNLFPSASSIARHYFCSDCQVSVGSSVELKGLKETSCMKCNKVVKVNAVDSENYFVTLSVREQIQKLLDKPDLKLVQDRSGNSNLCDIFDGEHFKTCELNGLPLKNCLTVTFNTDGVSFQDSTTKSMWPIFLYLNEVVPEQRFKVENLVLAGLWFGSGSPNMALYLKQFLNEMLELSQNGVRVPEPDGSVSIRPVLPVACSLDSVAKPKVVCQKQFNGRYGCLYCLHPNDAKADDASDSKQRFYDTSTSYPLRSDDQVVKDMFEADKLDKEGNLKTGSVNGFIGVSILLLLSKMLDKFPCNPFSIIWSVVIDYMHCALEGITHDLLEMFESLLSEEKLKLLSDRITAIRPPQAMTRKPRPLSDKINWKAKEYRQFLLYYSLPCLHDILPSKYFNNLLLLVSSLHIFLGDNITPSLFSKAKSDLFKFITGFQQCYGLSRVTYNLHLLTHVPDLVLKMGPLWCYSNFVFESGNGRLVKLVKGTRSVINEIAIKFTKLQYVPHLIVNNPISETALSFCNNLLSFKYSARAISTDNSCLTGSSSTVEVTPEELPILESGNVLLNGTTFRYYHKVIRQGIAYCSAAHYKSTVFDDSCASLSNNRYVYIDKIVLTQSNEIMCLVRPIFVAVELIPAVKQCSYDCFGDLCLIPFSEILRKCVFVSFSDKKYVCTIPNFYERD